MTTILVGRAGEDLHSFHLEDVERGAVRDSGLFPELYEFPMPVDVSAALISGVDRKLQEHRMSAQGYDFPIFLPPSLLPKALEDSKEAETDQINIVWGKLQRGYMMPIFNYAATLSSEQSAEFFQSIALRAQTSDISHQAVFADDRATFIVDDNNEPYDAPVILEELYGFLRDHHNPQVREIFEPGHGFPGKRVKEVDGAQLGILNSLYNWQEAKKRIKARGIPFTGHQRMDTTLCFVPAVPGALPLPEQGLIIKAIGAARSPREITRHDISQAYKGRIATYDHFDRPVGGRFPDWATLHDIKRSLAPDQKRQELLTYRAIDKEDAWDYLTREHSPGAAMSAALNIFETPKKGEVSSLRPKFVQGHSPKKVLTSGNLLSGEISREDLNAAFPINGDKQISNVRRTFSLRKLEKSVHEAQAFAVVDPDKYPITEKDIKKFGSEENVKLIRELETAVISAYLTTMSTMAGATQHIGRPNLVDEKWYRKSGLYHPDLCNLGLTGDAEKEAYQIYKDQAGVEAALEDFDPMTYRHQVNTPKNEFLTEAEIKKKIGKKDLGYVVNVYGSSTGYADETYRYPKRLSYLMSKRKNVTIGTGAGVRSAMRGGFDGQFDASEEGYRVSHLGSRSLTDVSPLEGNIVDFFDENGYSLENVDDDGTVMSALDGQVSILNFLRILARQHALGEVGYATTTFDGGKGSVLEFYLTALHNAYLNTTGKGLFSHDRRMPNVVINRDIEFVGQKRGVLDTLVENWRDRGYMIGLKEFTGEDPVPEAEKFLVDHAEGREMIYGQTVPHNFDLSHQDVVAPALEVDDPYAPPTL